MPVFVIQGAQGFTTPTSLARAWIDSIAAPTKAFVPIGGAGHFAVITDANTFLDVLTTRVTPMVSAH